MLNQYSFTNLFQFWYRQSSSYSTTYIRNSRSAGYARQIHVDVPLTRQSPRWVVSSPLIQISHILWWRHCYKENLTLFLTKENTIYTHVNVSICIFISYAKIKVNITNRCILRVFLYLSQLFVKIFVKI